MTADRVLPAMSFLRHPLLLLRPFRRSAWMLFAWSQRHSLSLWWRSLRAEVKPGRPIDFGRVRRLATVLMKVTTDQRISNASELKQLTLVDDVVIAYTDESWAKKSILISTLAKVSHVSAVQFA